METILRPGRNCWSVEKTEHAGVLIDARAYYRAFVQAARSARGSIYISGWQFDTDAELLRGSDAPESPAPSTFLSFLNFICERNPQLKIHILAWDFSGILAFNREWLEDWLFRWRGHENITFRFDSCHSVGGSHHQKLVVIDRWWAFAGGIDICNTRWDDRDHAAENVLRKDPQGKAYPPKHDVQAFVGGEVGRELARWFEEQWKISGAEPIPASSAAPQVEPAFEFSRGLSTSCVGLSQTQGAVFTSPKIPDREVERLFSDAVRSAERLIYIEAQYVTSKSFFGALSERLKQRSTPRLQVVLILPHDREPLENVSLVPTEIRMLQALTKISEETGHAFGCYQVLAPGSGGRTPVQIHSKLIIVDDRFLTIGSANLTNRSMGVDTELNLAWDAALEDPPEAAIESFRDLRTDLLLEHLRVSGPEWKIRLEEADDLVASLNQFSQSPSCSLQRYAAPDIGVIAASLANDDFPADPETTVIDDFIIEALGRKNPPSVET